MAVKSQANIDAGAGLALAGSRQKGVELATSATGTNIAGTDICEEFGHSGSGTGSDINIGSYHTGSGGLVPTAGNTSGLIAASAPGEKQFSDYIGGAAISAPTTWTVDRLYFNPIQNTFSGTNIFSEAFVYMEFQHDASNNRIVITYGSGTSANYHTAVNVNYDYVGLSSATWQVRYNVTGQARSGDSANSQCFSGSRGPTPVQDGYNSGTYYTLSGTSRIAFWWMAYANPNSFCQGQGSIIGGFNNNPSSNVYAFQLKATLGSDTFEAYPVYSTPLGGNIGDAILLSAGTNMPNPL